MYNVEAYIIFGQFCFRPLCFGSMSPVVSAQTAVYWSLPTLTEVKLENTDVKLAMIVGVQ